MEKCPGNSIYNKKPEEIIAYIKCDCGSEVEIWFDEAKAKCLECKEYVFKNEEDLIKDFKCASWCEGAEKCLGPKTYQKFKEAKKEYDKKQSELEKKVKI